MSMMTMSSGVTLYLLQYSEGRGLRSYKGTLVVLELKKKKFFHDLYIKFYYRVF